METNYTTPEQSRRLLKLGLPAETADCVLENLDTAENDFAAKDYTRWIIEERHVKADIFTENNKGIFLPCWSVGRMIEILLKKHGNRVFCYENTEMPLAEAFVQRLEYWMEKGYDFKNFQL